MVGLQCTGSTRCACAKRVRQSRPARPAMVGPLLVDLHLSLLQTSAGNTRLGVAQLAANKQVKFSKIFHLQC